MMCIIISISNVQIYILWRSNARAKESWIWFVAGIRPVKCGRWTGVVQVGTGEGKREERACMQ